jgi:hypothetical protein
MAFQDPVAVFTAASNVEAHFVCGLLQQVGVEASVVEDENLLAGPLSGWVRPQVWVDRADVERVQPLFLEYEKRLSDRTQAEKDVPLSPIPPPDAVAIAFWFANQLIARQKVPDAESVRIFCEDCGQDNLFGMSLLGTVQKCEHCGAYVDVELPDSEPGDFGSSEDIQEGDPED